MPSEKAAGFGKYMSPMKALAVLHVFYLSRGSFPTVSLSLFSDIRAVTSSLCWVVSEIMCIVWLLFLLLWCLFGNCISKWPGGGGREFVCSFFWGKGIVSVAKGKFYLHVYFLSHSFAWKSNSNVLSWITVWLKEWNYVYKIQLFW